MKKASSKKVLSKPRAKTKSKASKQTKQTLFRGMHTNKYVLVLVAMVALAGGFFTYRSLAATPEVYPAVHLNGFGCAKHYRSDRYPPKANVNTKSVAFDGCHIGNPAVPATLFLHPLAETGVYEVCVWGRHIYRGTFSLNLHADNKPIGWNQWTDNDYDETRQLDNRLVCDARFFKKHQRPSFIFKTYQDTWITNITVQRM